MYPIVLDGLKGGSGGDIVDEDGAVHAAVVERREGAVLLLPRRVPHVELGPAAVDVDGLSEEGGTDGGHGVLLELVVHEAHCEGGLTDVRLAHCDHCRGAVEESVRNGKRRIALTG
eukprot:scaffold1193_cov159-Ochromonas_danica.AAC.14